MRAVFAALGLAALAMTAPAAAQTPAPSPPAGPVHVVTYLEFAGDFVTRARDLLVDYRGKTEREPGEARLGAFEEIGQPNRFVLLETWPTAAARETHAQSAGGAPRADWLKQGELAPADARLHKNYDMAAAKAPTASAVYVFTHVDVSPPGLPALEAILKPLAEKSRTEPGVARFDIVQSTTRPNHFTFIEAWESEAAAKAHGLAAHTREFREKLHPLLGALYDQRFYKFIP